MTKNKLQKQSKAQQVTTSPSKGKTQGKRARALGVGLCLMQAFFGALPGTAEAGQTIDVAGVYSGIYGNSLSPNYSDDRLGDPKGNTVHIREGSDIRDGVLGALYSNGNIPGVGADASGNTVNVYGGSVGDSVFGGNVSDVFGAGKASGNSVNILGGSVGNAVYGGSTFSQDAAETNGNTVNISGGAIDSYSYGGYAYSMSGAAEANGNTVNISGGSITGSAYGGLAAGTSASASGNHISIEGGVVSGMYFLGGFAQTTDKGDGHADNNTIIVKGGKISGTLIGGFVNSPAETNPTTAHGNHIIIEGGEIGGYVRGGFIDDKAQGTFAINNNVITLTGSPKFAATTRIFGGSASVKTAGDKGDIFTGNTLNIWQYKGSAVAQVHNFEYFNFVLPAEAAEGDAPALNITDSISFDGSANGGKGGGEAKVSGVSFMGGGRAPQAGETFKLMQWGNVAAGADKLINGNATIQGTKGASLVYDLELATDYGAGGGLTATVIGDPTVNPQMKSLSEGWLAALSLTTLGQDLAADKGMEAAKLAAGAKPDGKGWQSFAGMSGGRNRYNSGSHVDTDNFSMLTGLAKNIKNKAGSFTLGAFLEYGTGSYDTYNSFPNAADVNGDGSAWYAGGGILGRMDFDKKEDIKPYVEFGARIGSLHNSFGANLGGAFSNYDTSSRYYSLHAGLGAIRKLTSKSYIDLYGKYFYTRQNGESMTLATGDPVRFDDADSSRLRLGMRYGYKKSNRVEYYLGAAWEHEFDGRVTATVYDLPINAPGVKGDTGIMELGVKVTPSKTRPVSIDIGLQGYAGKREGVTASARFNWMF